MYILPIGLIFHVIDCFEICSFFFQSIQENSSSKVKFPNIEKTNGRGGEKFQARNWKVLSKKDIQKLPPQQRSKYMAVRKGICPLQIFFIKVLL